MSRFLAIAKGWYVDKRQKTLHLQVFFLKPPARDVHEILTEITIDDHHSSNHPCKVVYIPVIPGQHFVVAKAQSGLHLLFWNRLGDLGCQFGPLWSFGMWREPVHLRIGDRTTGDFGEIVHQEKPKKGYGSCLSPAVHSLQDLVCKFIDFIWFYRGSERLQLWSGGGALGSLGAAFRRGSGMIWRYPQVWPISNPDYIYEFYDLIGSLLWDNVAICCYRL